MARCALVAVLALVGASPLLLLSAGAPLAAAADQDAVELLRYAVAQAMVPCLAAQGNDAQVFEAPGYTRILTQENNAGLQQQYLNGNPSSVSVAAHPSDAKAEIRGDAGFYVTDRWTIDRLTVNAGLRIEYFKAGVGATQSPAGRFIPARSVEAFSPWPTWTDVLPRLSVVYDLFGNAKTALEAFERGRPDVLLSDIAMPGQNGFELIARVRALPPERGGQVPAAALTAFSGPADQERVLASGFTLHIPKPVEPIQLVMAIAALVGRGTSPSEAGSR